MYIHTCCDKGMGISTSNKLKGWSLWRKLTQGFFAKGIYIGDIYINTYKKYGFLPKK